MAHVDATENHVYTFKDEIRRELQSKSNVHPSKRPRCCTVSNNTKPDSPETRQLTAIVRFGYVGGWLLNTNKLDCNIVTLKECDC